MANNINKVKRVWLAKKTREQLIRSYIERKLAKYEMLPTEEQVLEAVGGGVSSIRMVLQEYRKRLPKDRFSHKGRHLVTL